jgi:hypothetical protein
MRGRVGFLDKMLPPMKVYRVSAEKMEVLRPSLMGRVATVLTISIAASAFISFRALGNDADIRFVLLVCLWLGGVCAFAVFKAARKGRSQLDNIVETYELEFDSTRVTRRLRGLSDATLDYSAIRRIEEHGPKGLTITGDSKLGSIGVPSALEGYEEAKAQLLSLTGLEIQHKSGSPAGTYAALILVVGLMAVGFLAQNRLLASGASFACAALVLAANILARRSPNVPRELKRRLFWSWFAAFFILLRGILLLWPQFK